MVLNYSTFDPELEKAVLFAVGNTLVCDELEEAKVLSWTGERFKGMFMFPSLGAIYSYTCTKVGFIFYISSFLLFLVVTVDGILLTKSGTMTGGTSGGMEAKSNKWDDKKIEGWFVTSWFKASSLLMYCLRANIRLCRFEEKERRL